VVVRWERVGWHVGITIMNEYKGGQTCGYWSAAALPGIGCDILEYSTRVRVAQRLARACPKIRDARLCHDHTVQHNDWAIKAHPPPMVQRIETPHPCVLHHPRRTEKPCPTKSASKKERHSCQPGPTLAPAASSSAVPSKTFPPSET
jgi:hypothetical protein